MYFIKLTKIDQEIASLQVTRPDVRNALHWEAMAEFAEAIQLLEADPGLRVLLISGAGEAFISGADLDMVSSLHRREDGEQLSKVMGDALTRMRSLPCITIAVIDGPARGGGAEIAVSCDMRFMSTEATIAFVHTNLGLIPGWGGASRLYSLVGYAKSIEYLASAKVIDATEALRFGLVNAVYPKHRLSAEVHDLANKIAAADWEAVQTIKRMLVEWDQSMEDQRLKLERNNFVELWDREERRRIFKTLTSNNEQ